MCRYLGVSRSGYYDYADRIDIPAKDLPLANRIQECQDKCGKTYGYRRVHIWLERQGIHHNPKTILRVMQKYNLIKSGLQIFPTSKHLKAHCIYQSTEISMIIVLSLTKQEQSKM